MDDFPHPYLLAYINASATLTADFAAFCRHQLEGGVPAASTERGIREFIKDMTHYHDTIQEFHDRFATDPEAEFRPHSLREAKKGDN
ncbi:hypothetical protein ACMG4M_05130 [Alcanivorax sp. IL3]|uniref:hypothetical protein n=1 Tax=unclassified Alcanivorax TaxID=2638842 RepID=UPI0039C15EE6